MQMNILQAFMFSREAKAGFLRVLCASPLPSCRATSFYAPKLKNSAFDSCCKLYRQELEL